MSSYPDFIHDATKTRKRGDKSHSLSDNMFYNIEASADTVGWIAFLFDVFSWLHCF